jgi:hypothetical protein
LPSTKSFVGVTRDRLGVDDTAAVALSDGVSIQGDGSLANPFRVANLITNTDIAALALGMPVTASGKRARNDSTLALASVVGLCTSAAAPAAVAESRGASAMNLSTAQWDARTGQVGGLTVGPYWVGGLGLLTNAAPTTPGRYVAFVGYAISTTVMVLQVARPILL